MHSEDERHHTLDSHVSTYNVEILAFRETFPCTSPCDFFSGYFSTPNASPAYWRPRLCWERCAPTTEKWPWRERRGSQACIQKFYEAPDLKRIRKVLDDNSADAAAVEELVRSEDSDLTDYLNFFEFMAYLKDRRQLSKKDVAALFDYYLRLLSKHKDVRKYVLDDRNGYGYLKILMARFPAGD